MTSADHHFAVVYESVKRGTRIVSLTHVSYDTARSTVDMLNRHATSGIFHVEDEQAQERNRDDTLE